MSEGMLSVAARLGAALQRTDLEELSPSRLETQSHSEAKRTCQEHNLTNF